MIPKSIIDRYSLVDTGKCVPEWPTCMIYEFTHPFSEGMKVYLMDVDIDGWIMKDDRYLIYIKGETSDAYMRNVSASLLMGIEPDILYQLIEKQYFKQRSIFSLN